MVYISSSSAATKKFGFDLARKILRLGPGRRARVLALTGDLGSGKTTLVQGFFRGLGLRRRATSPTFILMRRAALGRGKFRNVFHLDAYRLRKLSELQVLELEPVMLNSKNIVLIEWADRIKGALPRLKASSVLWVRLSHGQQENQRVIGLRNTKKYEYTKHSA
ncbi:MAG: tRNA (adenosine(37)-N6)-threonylcarbamoyltransferase complex ATPase subunit type 1 TsaE [Patescibacteria group bacterium]